MSLVFSLLTSTTFLGFVATVLNVSILNFEAYLKTPIVYFEVPLYLVLSFVSFMFVRKHYSRKSTDDNLSMAFLFFASQYVFCFLIAGIFAVITVG
jgi:hypothetical protein